MLLAAALMALSFPQMSQPVVTEPHSSAAVVEDAKSDSSTTSSSTHASLPSAPAPKIATEAESSSLEPAAIRPAEPVKPVKPPKFALRGPEETRGQRIAWLSLAGAGHAAAAFDAYETRQAISGGYGHEANPLLRPFSHSGTLYVATQVSPTVMDFVGHKMMRSRSPLIRKMWWMPQAFGAGASFVAGMHNRSIVK